MDVKSLYKKYSLNTYSRQGPVFVKGKGSWLEDQEGNRYLDLFPGWGVSILGHCHRRLNKVINSQAKKLLHLPNNLFSSEQALLAEKISQLSFSSKLFFANSGAEAVEAAIKFSRLWRPGASQIVVMKNSFHGRTFGALSATGQKKYKQNFKPLLPGFKEARFNDFGHLKSKVNSKTSAIILELIQGEGGVNIAKKDYIEKIARFCRKKKILLIIDEVQTGMGRTGKLFCCQHYNLTPDILILSKGLGAGVPISAVVVKKRIADIIKPGMHASTFGGSPFVTRVASEVFDIIKEEKILNNVRKQGIHLRKSLLKLKDKISSIKKIKGMALMQAIECSRPTIPIFKTALEKGLIVNSTQENILRIMPALNVTKAEIDKGIDILEGVFKLYE
ncbi:MAG: aspartate aminotransferase family protein [Candidatus Omnitrophica bacterium]|nr:aspartate aminotransferase family protein [Candidatus Omnitrophota bacterium]MCF7877279.1 aspartate aminotransferase family protein [Candidatus Omnitrophota bacterium]MCF7878191.1 aspartate aminotransferase family protein [Candidatus Omnitrophota bacterium]MCF7892685.1 aspartate aminotransferase family protein [Candidatus Omnitrophota bacterium]